MNVVSFEYTLAAVNKYALAVPYRLAGSNLINSDYQGTICFISEIPSRQRMSGFVMAGHPATIFSPSHLPKCSWG